MKVHEIMENASAGASSSGGVATISQPMGVISRTGGSPWTDPFRDLTVGDACVDFVPDANATLGVSIVFSIVENVVILDEKGVVIWR